MATSLGRVFNESEDGKYPSSDNTFTIVIRGKLDDLVAVRAPPR